MNDGLACGHAALDDAAFAAAPQRPVTLVLYRPEGADARA